LDIEAHEYNVLFLLSQEKEMSKSSIATSAKKILDSQGRQKTLLTGAYSFMKLNYRAFQDAYKNQEDAEIAPTIKKKVLFLGLGCNADTDAINLCKKAEKVYYLEWGNFEKACAESNILLNQPKNFIKLTDDALSKMLTQEGSNFHEWEFFLYKQNLSLFPGYWSNVLMTLEELFTKQYDDVPEEEEIPQKLKPSIFVAGSSNDLIHRELCDAVKSLGYDCLTTDMAIKDFDLEASNDEFTSIASMLRTTRPSLFLSINGRNLDDAGRVFYLLKQLNIPIVLWIVDNPWNILSGFKQDWWKECIIYVTDDSFVSMIKSHGATHVHHLPLAASTYSLQQTEDAPETNLLYVGHSSFKNKEKFFSAVDKQSGTLSVCRNLVDKHFELLLENSDSTLVDFHKIYSLLYPTKSQKLWPGNDFRVISHFATETDNYQKAYWLDALAQYITIVGDKGWQALLEKKLTILPPVDYYTQLPAYYANAKFTVNITSLLMPNALTQRHFDVWLAGGFLISSPTSGIEIFQSDITNLIIAKNPQMALALTDKYTTRINAYKEIQLNMRNLILANHFYSHRLQTILSHI